MAFVLLSLVWNIFFPINKNLWTSSFVLLTGGLSLFLLSIFYYVIDVLESRRWAFFFTVIGMNSIMIYMSGKFINWSFSNKAIFGWLGQLVGDPATLVVMPICYVAIKWAFLYFMYRKNVFLRV